MAGRRVVHLEGGRPEARVHVVDERAADRVARVDAHVQQLAAGQQGGGAVHLVARAADGVELLRVGVEGLRHPPDVAHLHGHQAELALGARRARPAAQRPRAAAEPGDAELELPVPDRAVRGAGAEPPACESLPLDDRVAGAPLWWSEPPWSLPDPPPEFPWPSSFSAASTPTTT